ncbi:DUF4398 domain-containing protein [Undibacterium sp. RuRC25W]|uniref:DUF4398 domain-containing protein n=1 Tax=Undibacterium sp. RuRC25W TaxID=3413047 RepID=UPI003BEF911F
MMSISQSATKRGVQLLFLTCLPIASIAFTACNSVPTSVIAEMAVSTSDVNNAAAVGGGTLAPDEMRSARERLKQANNAMAAYDYQAAADYANQAQAEAKLVQTKVSSIKAQQAAAALQEDIRVLREELYRVNNSK